MLVISIPLYKSFTTLLFSIFTFTNLGFQVSPRFLKTDFAFLFLVIWWKPQNCKTHTTYFQLWQYQTPTSSETQGLFMCLVEFLFAYEALSNFFFT